MPDEGSRIVPQNWEALKAIFTAIVGADHATDDADILRLHSEDIWSAAASQAALIVAPESLDQVARVVSAATAAGLAIAPRGAGMSYTGGYIPAVERTLSLDMSRMNRILEIRADDMIVTVEAGCSWKDLNAALAPLGLRTPFWGPMSGLVSTIGGGLSQLNAMFGAGHYGTSSESVVALTIVLADGSILRTGARGADGDSPFYRHFGPDLAGLFCGDCGAFGVKAEISLRLIRAPAHEDYASFAFKTGPDLLKAMAEMARAGIACEMCAFDPGLTKVRMARASLGSDVKTLGAVVAKQKSLVKGLVAAGKVAMAGRNFIEPDEYAVHVIAEGRSAAAVEADMAEARRIAALFGGREVENSIAKIIRAMPFPPLNSVLGPNGDRWAPVHGVVSLSQAPAVFEAIQALFAELAESFARFGIQNGYLFSSMSTNALIIEPLFYWPEARFAIHEVAIEPSHLAKLPTLPPNPEATAVVAVARKRLIETFARFGCGHFQIGRAYPYRQSRDQASWRLIEALKAAVDPPGAFNPGVLGLTKGDAA
jgi:D-lactate dehydrogenase (cytochrome)